MEQLINTVCQKLSEQGLTVVLMAFALWYLHVKLTKMEVKIQECEQDRLKLWERISQLK
jgi:hypothetical protein